MATAREVADRLVGCHTTGARNGTGVLLSSFPNISATLKEINDAIHQKSGSRGCRITNKDDA